MNPNADKIVQLLSDTCIDAIDENSNDLIVGAVSGAFVKDGRAIVIIFDTAGFPYRLIVEDATRYGEEE